MTLTTLCDLARALALVALTGAGVARAAEPTARLRLAYEVYYHILRVASLQSDTTFEPHAYRMEMTLRTEGLVGTLFPWTLHAESHGAIASTGLRPETRRGESTHRGEVWRVEMTYRDTGAPSVTVDDPAARRGQRDDVPGELRDGTVDPLTATLTVLRGVAGGQGCATTQRVFDGRLRYDVRYEDLGTGELAPSRYRTYAGPTRLCRSTLEPIAGFEPTARDDGRRVVTRSWIAPPLAGAPPVPVQLEMTGRRGTLLFYLRSAAGELQ